MSSALPAICPRPDRADQAGYWRYRLSAQTANSPDPELPMLDAIIEEFPEAIELKGGFKCVLRPLERADEKDFHEFFLAVPELEVIRDWCQNIDLGRNLPLLAVTDGRIIGDATLHQQLGGWKRHIGRVSVLVHPQYRGRG